MQLDSRVYLVTHFVDPGLSCHRHAFTRHDAGIGRFRHIDELACDIAGADVFVQSGNHVPLNLVVELVVHCYAYSSNGEVPVFADFC